MGGASRYPQLICRTLIFVEWAEPVGTQRAQAPIPFRSFMIFASLMTCAAELWLLHRACPRSHMCILHSPASPEDPAMGGNPVKSEEASDYEARRCGDGLADIINDHWPVDVLTIKMDVLLKVNTTRTLREIAECAVFSLCGVPGPSLECFAFSCTERLEARLGHEHWFWEWPWPELIGSATAHFWPARLAPFKPVCDRVTQFVCASETQEAFHALMGKRASRAP